MAYSPRSGGSGGFKGGKKFGNSAPPWASNSRSGGFGGDREKPQLFPTTCAACGNRCEVPFRPNGKKPVYCSNCFVRDEESGPKRFNDRSERPSFDRSSSDDRRPPAGAGASNSETMEMLKKINAKLDTILKALGNGNTF